MERKAALLSKHRRLESISKGDICDLLQKSYAGDNLVEHVLNKPRAENQQSPATPVRYCVDEKGLIRYSAGGVGTPASSHPLYVPVDLRQSVLFIFHGLPMMGHLGLDKSWPMLRKRFIWPAAKRDLKAWI